MTALSWINRQHSSGCEPCRVSPSWCRIPRARTLWQASEQVSQELSWGARPDRIKVIHPAIVTEVRMPRDADSVLELRCRGGWAWWMNCDPHVFGKRVTPFRNNRNLQY